MTFDDEMGWMIRPRGKGRKTRSSLAAASCQGKDYLANTISPREWFDL